MKSRSKDLNLNLLKYLDALLSERNVTHAARLSNVSQSTMSGIFGRLRDEFNDPLLVRHGRKYELSPLGRVLSISVRHVLLQIDAMMLSRSRFDPATDDRTFRIIASDYATRVLLRDVFHSTEKTAPNLRYELLPIHSPTEMISDGEADICIMDNLSSDSTEKMLFNIDYLFSDHLTFVADANHPVKEVADPDIILSYPIVSVKASPLMESGDYLDTMDARLKNAARLSVWDFTMVPGLISGSQAIGILPFRMLPLPTSQVRHLPVSFEMPHIETQMVWHSRFDHDPAFCWLRNVILGCAAKLRGEHRQQPPNGRKAGWN